MECMTDDDGVARRELASAVAALRSGDMSALDAFVRLARAAGKRVASRLIDDQEAVDDVVQEALLEALATLHQLRQPASFLAWYGLVVRKQTDRHRRRQRPVVSLSALDPFEADGSDQPEVAHCASPGLARRAVGGLNEARPQVVAVRADRFAGASSKFLHEAVSVGLRPEPIGQLKNGVAHASSIARGV